MNIYEKDYPCVLFSGIFRRSNAITVLRQLYDTGGFMPCYITPEKTFRGISEIDENIAFSKADLLILEDNFLVEIVRHHEEEYHVYIPSRMYKVIEIFLKFRRCYNFLYFPSKDIFYITDLIHSIINSSTYLNGLDL